MNFFNRAIKNVTRKSSKSILLGLTFLLIGNFVIVGIGISKAATNAKTITRKSMTPVVNYEIDYNAYYDYINLIEDVDEQQKAEQNYPRINSKELEELVKDPRVSTASALDVRNLYVSKDTTYVKLNNQAEENMNSGNWRNPEIIAKSNLLPDMIELHNGTYTILDGRFYTQEEIDSYAPVALVTKEFAEVNNLNVGDTFYVASQNYTEYTENNYYEDFDFSSMDLTEDSFTAELQVIGIYDTTEKVLPGSDRYDWMSPYENPANTILTPPNAITNQTWETDRDLQIAQMNYYMEKNPEWYEGFDITQLESKDYYLQSYISSATILLNDPIDLDPYVEELTNNAPEYRMVRFDNSDFEKYSKPLDTISLFADFIVWLVVINAIVIITLVTALTLKTREYEIGVLLSLGASKLKIVAQFFVELAIVAVIGFTLAVGTGTIISKQIGNKVLDYAIAAADVTEKENFGWDDGYIDPWNTNYSTDVTLDDFVAQYEVKISPAIILMVYGVGLSITLVSIIIPSAMIMRFNPKKILMNQN